VIENRPGGSAVVQRLLPLLRLRQWPDHQYLRLRRRLRADRRPAVPGQLCPGVRAPNVIDLFTPQGWTCSTWIRSLRPVALASAALCAT
jgi:hypothetical protein